MIKTFYKSSPSTKKPNQFWNTFNPSKTMKSSKNKKKYKRSKTMISLIKRKFKSTWKPFNILSTIEAQSTHLAAKKMKLAKTNPDAATSKNQNLAPSTSTPISRIFMMLTSCKRSRNQKSERKASQKEDLTLPKSQVDLMNQEVLNSKIIILDFILFFTFYCNLEVIFISLSDNSPFHLNSLIVFF